MRTHPMPTGQYHSPHEAMSRDTNGNHDMWIVGAILAAVFVMFAAYMWYAAAHFSDQYNIAPDVQTSANDTMDRTRTSAIAPTPEAGNTSATTDNPPE